MNQIVVDASVALAWCFPDEGSAYANAALESLEGQIMLVPSLWAVEITNGLVVGKRRKRLDAAAIRRFLALLEQLPILQDSMPVAQAVNGVLPLADQFSLSAYDATYLELAIRHGAPLASLDAGLQRAAQRSGVPWKPTV